MNNATATALKAAPTRPPTTPPAIAPAFELLLCGVEVEVDDEPVLVAPGVVVDSDAKIVVGTMEAVPVTSGESPVASASVEFQLSATDVSMYAHLGIRVPAGICSGKIPGLALAAAVQLKVHSE